MIKVCFACLVIMQIIVNIYIFIDLTVNELFSCIPYKSLQEVVEDYRCRLVLSGIAFTAYHPGGGEC